MTHVHDEPGRRPCLYCFDAVGGAAVRSTGQLTSENIVTDDTRRVERISTFKAADISWRDVVRLRIDVYLPTRRDGFPNQHAVY